jgi:hypothetical protein
MLLFEVVVTRLFSVLFFYHFSFFAISLVMSGLVLGGILASRWDAGGLSEQAFSQRLALLGALFSAGTTAAVLALTRLAQPNPGEMPSLLGVAVYALLFLPGLVAAGAFLALAFARDKRWIGGLYAADLIAASVACIAAIGALRALQGPAVVIVVAGIAALGSVLIAPTKLMRGLGLGLLGGSLALLVADSSASGELLRLKVAGAPAPLLERWNEHSRVQVFDMGVSRNLVIDRSAATVMRFIPRRADGLPVQPDPSWAQGSQYKVYGVGRPLNSVAIIGVGGGSDLLPPLFHGAKRVDGYELNQTMIDLLERDFRDYNGITSRPELHLIHDEARVGIAHSGQLYDVIQASLIDTWAATASGGFVLSENSLYTREGWRVFLEHLTPTGMLTMTRWHLPDAPAETHRLVALAAAGLSDAGFPDATPHILLLRSNKNESSVAFRGDELTTICTIMVSKTPFNAAEVERVAADATATGGELMAAPGITIQDPVLAKLLVPATREAAIAASPFNIAPPSDLQPYFFLQVRFSDLINLSRRDFGAVTEITFNGVRVMVMLGICSLLLVLLVGALTALSLPGSAASAPKRGVYRWMTLYFLGIGLGYILVQIGLHQRLVIVLGHPTFALSVVLFSMLLGTGMGAAYSERLFPTANLRHALTVILAALLLLRLCFPLIPLLELVHSAGARAAIVSAVLAAVGFVLGLAFPLGVRHVAPTGEWATQKMWAINGAASIAASVLAAVIGLALGSGAVLIAGILAYGIALLGGIMSERSSGALFAEPSG